MFIEVSVMRHRELTTQHMVMLPANHFEYVIRLHVYARFLFLISESFCIKRDVLQFHAQNSKENRLVEI